MDFKMNVVIVNPDGSKTEELNLMCQFYKEENGYGNGYHMSVEGCGFDNYYDIRYDTAFSSDAKEEYLVAFAKRYWSGKNGAWSLKSVQVERA